MVTAHLSSAERVAEWGRTATEKFRFPDILRVALYPLKREQKVADVCQNRLTSLLADFSSGCRDEL
jgi:hypothetical protein